MISPSQGQPARAYATRSLSETAAGLEAACRARDAGALATFLTEHVMGMYAAQALPIVGREANRLAWLSVFETAGLVNPITVDEVVEAEQGDLGYTLGRWWQRQPGAAPALGGRWLAIWQPMDGAWQITHVSSNGHEDIASETVPA
jgi:ketosteroid isomerase-like protein